MLHAPVLDDIASNEVGSGADPRDAHLGAFELGGLFDGGRGPNLERQKIDGGAENDHIRTGQISGHGVGRPVKANCTSPETSAAVERVPPER